MLRFQLCSSRYTALQTKNSVRIIYPVTTENTDDSRLQIYCKEAMHRAIPQIKTLQGRCQDFLKGGSSTSIELLEAGVAPPAAERLSIF